MTNQFYSKVGEVEIFKVVIYHLYFFFIQLILVMSVTNGCRKYVDIMPGGKLSPIEVAISPVSYRIIRSSVGGKGIE